MLAETAVRRLMESKDPAKATSLFTEEERQQLADALAATNATAELLGRSRIRLRQKQIENRYAEYAERPKFTGTKKDSLGRNRCYDQGKPVPCAKKAPEKKEKPKPATKKAKPSKPKTELQKGPDTGVDPAANRPTRPDERHDAQPPKLELRRPPPPKGTGSGKAGGFTATGATNTAIGDSVESASEQLGFRSILPEGRRGGKSIEQEGSTLDREWDHSGYAFEMKACTTGAKEYKAKPKKAEADGKRKYAEKHQLKPATCIAVVDTDAGEVHYYWREGIGAYKLTPENAHNWNYAGSAKL